MDYSDEPIQEVEALLWKKAEEAMTDLEKELIIAEGELKYGNTA